MLNNTHLFELEVIPGLETHAMREAVSVLGADCQVAEVNHPGRLEVRSGGRRDGLLALRSVVAVHLVLSFDVPRPGSLLGHQHFSRILNAIADILKAPSSEIFSSFTVSAAGRESSVIQKFISRLSTETGLDYVPTQGHLLLALRRPLNKRNGWQVLIRITPMPLSARPWRLCNMAGALNATIAHVMCTLTNPAPDQRFVNLACGSGTLLVERLEIVPASEAVGFDTDKTALECSTLNLQASGHRAAVELRLKDATATDLPRASVDVVVTDLPFGMLVTGSMAINQLYMGIIHEATRITVAGGSLALISTRTKLLDRIFSEYRLDWSITDAFQVGIPVRSGYIYPKVMVAKRQ
jgi:tRNA (guanine6-N2)-methyltransferase